MDEKEKQALVEYGRIIKRFGWREGERFIIVTEEKFHGFRRWAYALGIMLRAKELLDGR